jgi:photosystem II stability/assembly factor-like uncharacterized protein
MCCVTGLQAQHWVKLSLPRSVGAEPYFLNPSTGFIFSHPSSGSTAQLARTNDGGQTWKSFSYFDTIGSFRCTLYQLSFVSPTHGYAAAYAQHDAGGIFETNDQGETWRRITPVGHNYTWVYAAYGSVFAIEGVTRESPNAEELVYTRNDGATWDTVETNNLNGLPSKYFSGLWGNNDSTIIAAWSESNTNPRLDTSLHFFWTSDLGNSWNSQLLRRSAERWRSFDIPFDEFFIWPHTCSLLRQCASPLEADSLDEQCFYRSSLNSWVRSLAHIESSMAITGTSCATYICSARNADTILFRTTDRGVGWVPILSSQNAPAFVESDDDCYMQLSVVGHGAVIYACDQHGRIYKTTDGGDGNLDENNLAPVMVLNHAPFPSGGDTLDVCQSTLTYVTAQNAGCSYATFDSIQLYGLSSEEYTINSTYHGSCSSVPDTSFIALYPNTPGVRELLIHFHYTDDEYNHIDTALHLVLNVKSGTSLPLSLTLGNSKGILYVNPGDTIDIPVYLSGDQSTTLTGESVLTLPFRMDTNTLNVLGFFPAPSVTVAGSVVCVKGAETVQLQLKDFSLNGVTLLGMLRCLVYFADTLQTSVALLQTSISSADPHCLSLSESPEAVSIQLFGCGESTLIEFMRTRLSEHIDRIEPNPARNRVVVWGTRFNMSDIDVFDVMGRRWVVPVGFVAPQNTAPLAPVLDPGHVELDVCELPPGPYFLRMGRVSARFEVLR